MKKSFKSIYGKHTLEHFGDAIVLFFFVSLAFLLAYFYFWVWQEWH